ncbi:cobalamin B12-binding domain-containing protein [Thermodesulfobacteriota bacterium]
MTLSTRKNRVLIAKPGLDGHDRGAKIIARALRDNEFEVIYTGIRQTPEEIASTAIQEDVAAIGLSSLSGAHLKLFPAVLEALKKASAGDIQILAGGIIPDEDIPTLKKAGIAGVFTPGASIKEIIEAFRDACDRFYSK